jgi:hypothetical protein
MRVGDDEKHQIHQSIISKKTASDHHEKVRGGGSISRKEERQTRSLAASRPEKHFYLSPSLFKSKQAN